MLKIRFHRVGKKKQPFYRIVVAEHTAPVQGKYLSQVGHYDPRNKIVKFEEKEVLAWMDKGAKPSNSVAKLLAKNDIKHKLIVVKTYNPKAAKKKLDPSGEVKAETPIDESSDATQETAVEEQPENEESNDNENQPIKSNEGGL